MLLVEGPNDKAFFEAFLKKHALDKIITTHPPKTVGGNYNSKQGAINILPTLTQNLIDGNTERLGLIVDSDSIANGGGLTTTLEQIAHKLEPYAYQTKPTPCKKGGFIFKNNDGLPNIGVWIMPNNKDEGAIEDWVSQLVVTSQKPLFSKACDAVNKIPNPLFPQTRIKKAEVATWLAWQKLPGKGLHYTIDGDLLDVSAKHYTGLLSWINEIFLAQ